MVKGEQVGIQNNENMHNGAQVVALNDVSFSSADRVLFYGVNLSVKKGENSVVVGQSGVGKSTLLKIALGKLPPDTGTVTQAKGIKISFVPQDIDDLDIDNDITIKDLFYKSRGLDNAIKRKEELEHLMASPEGQSKLEQILNEYSAVSEEYEKLGGYMADTEMDQILTGLKLDVATTGHITPQTKLTEVSSGQRTRILLGQALFANADLLVLDDPTSHLDVDSVKWLSEYLIKSEQATVIATNNIPFINTCANKIVEITDFGRVLSFEGNYDDYLIKRDRLLDAERVQAESVKAERDRIEKTYLAFKAKQIFKRSADMAQVGRAMQSRIQRLDDQYEDLPGSQRVHRVERVRSLVFETDTRSGDAVVTIQKLIKKYGDFTAVDLRNLNLLIRRSEFFLISGENGSGKSTLLRMIAAHGTDTKFAPTSGVIQLGTNVKLGYYAPDYVGISKEGSIFEEVKAATRHSNEGEASSTLHFWGFGRKTIRAKTIESLSAGEKKQLALAKIMVQHPNVLLLDEPTDYLKPEVIERLAAALNGFNGTIILISHNPEFKNSLHINRELQMPSGEIKLHENLK